VMAPGTPKLLPRHIAITMDGNGRWAEAHAVSRAAGHKEGLKPVRMCVEECTRRGIEALDREIAQLHEKGVRVRFIGERRSLSVRLQARIAGAEELTAGNRRLALQVAVSYGGRWDIVQAAQKLARECSSGAIGPEEIDESRFSRALALGGLPDADLLIRTGGEQRISNFLLWNAAYAELYFSERLWPDFAAGDLEDALRFFAARERRFGLRNAPALSRRGAER
jgi:undecaprenyl diphosphate synthase